jgi:hypothetical protein
MIDNQLSFERARATALTFQAYPICDPNRQYRNRKCPKWVNRAFISMFYAKAARLTRWTGVLHHVDHIVPVHGIVVSSYGKAPVCGLTVPWNLVVITGRENGRKGNRVSIQDALRL